MNLDLNGVSVNSEDPKKLAEFYQAVFDKKPEWEMEGFTGWKIGSSFLNIGPHSEVKGKNADAPRIMFVLTTEDVAGEYERIMKVEGAKSVAEPYKPGGDDDASDMWLATIEDPDGNYFQLATPWKD